MPSIKLIISDLHLADGHAILDGFGDAQQAALKGFLEAEWEGIDRGAESIETRSASFAEAVGAKELKDAPQASLKPLRAGGDVEDVELIINGDCFDFLVIPPFQTDSTTDPAIALGKLEKIIAAHGPFFEVLQTFISTPGHSVTFLAGNHDIELCFEEVCARIAKIIYGASGEGDGVHFCTSRFYRPLPDVYIEHGNQYDFWNSTSGIWDDMGHALTVQPDKFPLPFGSQYVLRVGHPISLAHPYFDHFEPSMNILRQIALLSLLDPELTIATAERLMGMLSYPRKALANLSPGDERIPARLFEHAMLDFLAFQQDVEARSPHWKASIDRQADTLVAGTMELIDTPARSSPLMPLHEDEANLQSGSANTESNEDTMMEFLTLRDALTLPSTEAIAAICTPVVYGMGEDVARGMQHVLNSDPALRYAIAGHSHMWRIDSIRSFQPADREAVDAVASLQAAFQESPQNGRQTYLNTGTWTTRVALPTPASVTPALIEWLRQPDWRNVPLRDMTQFTFVMISTSRDGPSEVRLCAWEGDADIRYRVIG